VLDESSCVKTTLELKLDLGPPAMPKIFVVSHERSGTHFLMNTLAMNFGYVSNPWINLDTELAINFYSPVAFRRFISMFQGKGIRNVFKSHHEFGFYKDLLTYMQGEYRILYIYREVNDVMSSMQRYLGRLPWHEGPKVDSYKDFVSALPSGAMQRYQYSPADSMIHRWRNHVEGWLNAIDQSSSDSLTSIRYEDLNNCFADTTMRISQFLRLPLTSDRPMRPSADTNIVSPNR
jgi:Sulfotransferase domain